MRSLLFRRRAATAALESFEAPAADVGEYRKIVLPSPMQAQRMIDAERAAARRLESALAALDREFSTIKL